eukprot:gene18387-25046_t
MYLGVSILLLAHSAWAASLARSYDDRARLFGVMAAVGVCGAVSVLMIPIVMEQMGYSEPQGVQAMIWFIMAATGASCLLVVLVSPEKIAKEQTATFALKDYWALLTRPNILRLLAADLFVTLGPGWMAAIYLFYFTDSLGATLGPGWKAAISLSYFPDSQGATNALR